MPKAEADDEDNAYESALDFACKQDIICKCINEMKQQLYMPSGL